MRSINKACLALVICIAFTSCDLFKKKDETPKFEQHNNDNNGINNRNDNGYNSQNNSNTNNSGGRHLDDNTNGNNAYNNQSSQSSYGNDNQNSNSGNSYSGTTNNSNISSSGMDNYIKAGESSATLGNEALGRKNYANAENFFQVAVNDYTIADKADRLLAALYLVAYTQQMQGKTDLMCQNLHKFKDLYMLHTELRTSEIEQMVAGVKEMGNGNCAR